MLENASGELRLWSRNGRPLLRYFPELQPLGELLPPRSAIDGEIVIDIDGAIDFDAMQTRLHPAESRIRRLSAEIPAQFVGFDVLVWEGARDVAAAVRRSAARRSSATRPRSTSPRRLPTRTTATAWLEELELLGLDGVVAKRLDLPVEPGRSRRRRQGQAGADRRLRRRRRALEVEARPKIATLLLGLYDDDGRDRLRRLGRRRGEQARRDRRAGDAAARRGVSDRRFSEPNRWGGSGLEEQPLRPELVAEVRYDKVQGRRFRHGTKLLRFRPDKDPGACTWAELRPPREPAGLPSADLLGR